MKWKCTKCQTENKDTYICLKCGFDESRNYAHYATIAVLREKDKAVFKKMIFKGDNVLMACPDTELVFGKKMDKSKIKSIEIYNTLSKVNKSAWDASAHKDGSVKAWIEDDKDGWKHLKLAAEGDIIANEDSSGLFDDYDNMDHIGGLKYLNTEKVTDMNAMFCKCKSLKTLDLSNFDTRNVTDMSSMFYECGSLQNLDLSDLDTGKVTNMSNMFEWCGSLQNLDLSDLDTGKVTDMSNMFEGCNNLRNLDLSNLDTGKVTDMSEMFKDCNSLQNLDLSNLDTRKVTSMEAMFRNCESLQELDLSKFDTGNVGNMDYMFQWCKSLRKLNINNFDISNATIDWIFNGCENLKKIYVNLMLIGEDLEDLEEELENMRD